MASAGMDKTCHQEMYHRWFLELFPSEAVENLGQSQALCTHTDFRGHLHK